MSASENASRAEEQPRKRIKLEAFSEQDISKLGNVILGYSGHGNPVKKTYPGSECNDSLWFQVVHFDTFRSAPWFFTTWSGIPWLTCHWLVKEKIQREQQPRSDLGRATWRSTVCIFTLSKPIFRGQRDVSQLQYHYISFTQWNHFMLRFSYGSGEWRDGRAPRLKNPTQSTLVIRIPKASQVPRVEFRDHTLANKLQ